jgi:hypothetical protein
MKNAASELAPDYQTEDDMHAFSDLDDEDFLDEAGES